MSLVVVIVKRTLPEVGIVTLAGALPKPKSPVVATVTLTGSAAGGAGLALMVKLTDSPSLPPSEPVMLTTGRGASSLSATVTVAADWDEDTV